ncbi:MAG: S8 family serine peptidase [Bacteroidales bacterium]|nr:S8 family serine peptidase [Bacteroidales bacterium]
MKKQHLFLLIVAIVAINLISRCSCSSPSSEESTVDTLIIGNDTIVVPKAVEEKEKIPSDSIYLIDTIQNRYISPVKKAKIYNPAPPFPSIDSSAIITDTLGRKLLSNRLGILIMNQGAGSSILNKWERQFKSLFPDSDYYVTYKEPFALVMQIAVPAEKRDSIRDILPDKINGIKFAVIDEELFESNSDKYQPNDPLFNSQIFNTLGYNWYYDKIQAHEAWSITKGSSKIVVAIVDDYFDLNHPELNSTRIVDPWSVITATRDVLPPDESYGHGTLVASLAIGNIDNNAGACGIAPNCSFMPISIGSFAGYVLSSAVTVGILRAIHSGADVINVSSGWAANFTEQGKSIKEQIRWSKKNRKDLEKWWNYVYQVAANRNTVIVYAAGNERDYIAVDPQKRSDNIICVSSVDMEDRWSSQFSNVGNFPEYDTHASTLSAPGEYMFGALPFGNYQIDLTPSRGTSYAAPLVTGAVALLKSIDNSLSNKEIIELLQKTGKPVQGKGGSSIGNIIQIYDALIEAKKTITCFDDFVRNPIGLWVSTEQSKCYTIINMYTGECGPYAGQTRHYYKINSLYENRICGEQIVVQVTDVKKIVHWVMSEPMYLDDDYRRVSQHNQDKIAITTSSYGGGGYLSEGNFYGAHGFYGANKMIFYRGKEGRLIVYGTDKWGKHFSCELKRTKKIKREYKAE